MKLFRWIWEKIRGWFGPRRERPLRTVVVEELPDCLDTNTIYVAGENGHFWFVAMLCPCGCGATLHMSLLADARPRWLLTRHEDGSVSLTPSVWRQVGCRSHFFLVRGKVQWCGPNSSGV